MPDVRASRRLLLVLLLALALRLVNLGERNLWYDEAFAILFADQGLSDMLYGTLTPVAGGAADIHPLLYYVTLDGWMALVGRSVFAVRLLSALIGVATIGVIYGLGRDLFDEKVGLAAALVAAVAPFHIQYSQEARMYSLLALLLAGATWAFARGWREPGRWRWWLVFGVLAALAMYTQQLAAFYLAALGVVPFLQRKRAPMIGVLACALVALILYLPWLVQLPAQWSKVGSYYWISPPTVARSFLTLRTFLSVGADMPMPWGVVALFGAIFILIFLPVQIILRLRRRAAERQPLLFVLWLFAAPVTLMWLVSQARPVYLERALLPSALMLYLLLGWLFVRGGLPRPIAVVVGAVGLALVGVGLVTHYTWNRFPNSPFRQAVASIEEAWQEGDTVLHQSKLSALPAVYYAPELDQRFIADAPGSPEDTLALPTRQVLGVRAVDCVQQVGGAGRVWFVVFPDVLRQAEAAGRDDVTAALNWLDMHYRREETQRFNDLDVMLFAEPDADASAARCQEA